MKNVQEVLAGLVEVCSEKKHKREKSTLRFNYIIRANWEFISKEKKCPLICSAFFGSKIEKQ